MRRFLVLNCRGPVPGCSAGSSMRIRPSNAPMSISTGISVSRGSSRSKLFAGITTTRVIFPGLSVLSDKR